MKRAGRISLLLLAAIVAVVIAVVVVFSVTGTESPVTVGTQFMDALVKGDVKRLTDLTYMDKVTSEEIRKQWDFTVHTAAPYYHFSYLVQGGVESGDKDAAVRLQITKNFFRPGAYAESYELPMVKVNGHWKVDVRGTNRGLFPGLPR